MTPKEYIVREIKVLMMEIRKRAAFWDAMLCSRVDHYEHFRGHC
jgi:hypothetical protein